MSELKQPQKCFFFYSVIYKESDWDLKKVKEILSSKHSIEPEIFYPEFNPSLEYYSKEMGNDLKRVFLCYCEPKERDDFVSYKVWVTKLEDDFSKEARTINIDLGMLNLENMILATGKPYAHRPYLGQGVYADLNYIYKSKSTEFLPWTYPDYQDVNKTDWFFAQRDSLKLINSKA